MGHVVSWGLLHINCQTFPAACVNGNYEPSPCLLQAPRGNPGSHGLSAAGTERWQQPPPLMWLCSRAHLATQLRERKFLPLDEIPAWLQPPRRKDIRENRGEHVGVGGALWLRLVRTMEPQPVQPDLVPLTLHRWKILVWEALAGSPQAVCTAQQRGALPGRRKH